jgi:uncharacterized metal-binding protein YceD (DUF177 family)
MTAFGVVSLEFSRPVSTTRLGADAMVYPLVANEAERAALARRFDIIALDSLAATVRLVRQGRDISLSAELAADVVQLCGVTLEPFASRVTDSATVLYRRQPPPADLAIEDEDYELLTDDTIDIGEAVAQQLSLALPLFPRAPGATIPPVEGEGGEIPVSVQLRADENIVPHPFAELAKPAKK